ncbi:hypothetical protein CY34DRAFT_345899 [Suillus luteus UH-Slu-Lm8-n1]|uniref:Uncharacterized protein n=1 Tax=Suillus luteus UH-Slu-Lm8-n1 TaxID=930992 RepID=A0A0D0AMD1_9AGAM|nr:hypothetical protein CY34DRAFT_345899 [Suillus luteus UH-Slu-Lm8-n1]
MAYLQMPTDFQRSTVALASELARVIESPILYRGSSAPHTFGPLPLITIKDVYKRHSPSSLVLCSEQRSNDSSKTHCGLLTMCKRIGARVQHRFFLA